jgi:hypothetical protein
MNLHGSEAFLGRCPYQEYRPCFDTCTYTFGVFFRRIGKLGLQAVDTLNRSREAPVGATFAQTKRISGFQETRGSCLHDDSTLRPFIRTVRP